VVERDGVNRVRPVATEVTVVETDEGPVVAPIESPPALTDDIVRETLEELRRRAQF
jgi:hypothetical protein